MSRAILSLALVAAGLTACRSNGSQDDASEGDTTAGEPTESGVGDFDFATQDPSAYVQVDRCGMPAINTAVIASKDRYNEVGPAEDAAGEFVDEIVASVTALHEALDDDLTAAGLVPCAAEDCVNQAAPLVVPDTIKIDPSAPAGFPNGRMLPDPVVDVTLAVVLLDLAVTGQDATTLAAIPLNPPANDNPFSPTFPYLAEPNN